MPARRPPPKTRPTNKAGEFLYGRHAVAAALGNPARKLRRLYVTDEALATELGAPADLDVSIGAKPELDRFLAGRGMEGAVHQGVALLAEPLAAPTLDDLLGGDATGPLVILDQVTDPHNVGAILRSAAMFGAAALIVTDRHAPHESAVLAKAASGALELVPIVRVVNLARALRELGAAGYWRVGLAEGGETLQPGAPGAKVALVLGAEGPGLRRLTIEHCDALVALPAAPNATHGFTTLNVSNAAAVALYAITR